MAGPLSTSLQSPILYILSLFPPCCLSPQQTKCTFEHVDGFPGDESQSCQGPEGLGISLLSHSIHQSKLQSKHTFRVVVVVDGLHLQDSNSGIHVQGGRNCCWPTLQAPTVGLVWKSILEMSLISQDVCWVHSD